MLLDPHFVNPYQQIEPSGQQKKLNKQFAFSKTQQFIHQQYQNQMSNLNESRMCILHFTSILREKTLNYDDYVEPNP